MRLATIQWHGASSAALVTSRGFAPVRSLTGRENAFDVMALITEPLRSGEVEDLVGGECVPEREVQFRAPILNPPKNVLCVGKNYLEHVAEGARAEGAVDVSAPKKPVWFTKAATALLGNRGVIRFDRDFTHALDYEGELALVIGTEGRSIPRAEVYEHIFGYTIFNDVTARDVQQAHMQWFRGKSADTYAPCGPWIVTADELTDPESLSITTRVDGEVRQQDNTRNLLFDIPTLVSDISAGTTLQPGDIIATGTPSGVAWGMSEPRYLTTGSAVEVEVEGIGILSNTVA